MILIDIDHFKNYNDDYGHPAGLLALADARLYAAKRHDRNRVCLAKLPDSRLAGLN